MRLLTSVLLILLVAAVARAQEDPGLWHVDLEVVDEHGAPVDDADVATFWGANGNWWDEAGELLPEAKAGQLWTNEGELVPIPRNMAERQPDGKFRLAVDGLIQVSVFAVDQRHERGGIALVDVSMADTTIPIAIGPLVRVTAEVYCSEVGKTPEWSSVRVFPVGDQGAHQSVTVCGSFQGKISLLLPPGLYEFRGNSQSPSARIRTPDGQLGIRVEIPRDQTSLDLGILDVTRARDASGRVLDVSQYYGKEPPELAITDARGVSQEIQLADYRGKWVLLDFWAVWCPPCIAGMPKLMEFYEEHAADRNRFEILAICNTSEEKAVTIEEYDALVTPLVENAWAGKPLPFPELVDGEGATFGAYGIVGWASVLLVDPEGRLVKDGNLAMLAEKLAENTP